MKTIYLRHRDHNSATVELEHGEQHYVVTLGRDAAYGDFRPVVKEIFLKGPNGWTPLNPIDPGVVAEMGRCAAKLANS